MSEKILSRNDLRCARSWGWGLDLVVLVDKKEYDSSVEVIEPREAEKLNIGWFWTIRGVTTVVVDFAVLTPKNDE